MHVRVYVWEHVGWLKEWCALCVVTDTTLPLSLPHSSKQLGISACLQKHVSFQVCQNFCPTLYHILAHLC